MKTTIIFVLLVILSHSLFSQSPSWHVLPNSPSSNTRMDDLSFINVSTGWIVQNSNWIGGVGSIYKTIDGGNSWTLQYSLSNVFVRCIGFTSASNGFVGTLGDADNHNRTPIMLKTTNGGATWDSVTFADNRPYGLCGMSVLNDNYIFACGRILGPAYFTKTTNGGLNWISQDMSAYASELVDCKFFSQDSGFVVGGVGTPTYSNGRAVILFTSNGGNTWIERYRGDRRDECWKINFPSRNTGYASTNTVSDTLFKTRTTNGGINWQRISFNTGNVPLETQGIGFLTENTGWVGGDSIMFKTINGGLSWQVDNFGRDINRIRFLNDTLGYATGQRVYKFTTEPIGIQPISTEIPKQFTLYQNYPNPFNPETKIQFEISPNPT